MGFWSFLKGRKPSEAQKPASDPPHEPRVATATKRAPPAPGPGPGASPPVDAPGADAIGRLARVGLAGGPGPDEALVVLQGLRTSPDEGRALQALAARADGAPLPERVAVAVAAALVDRGDVDVARRVLARTGSAADGRSLGESADTLLLRADLEALAGERAVAVALIERVLARDLDHPGARERHRRWRAELGFTEGETRPEGGSATIATAESDAPFRLLREVARGGSGAVYEAEDRELGRRVALKIYHRVGRDRAQLLHEARVAASLAGPGVVRVYDVDPDHGWIALQWAALGALRDLLRAKDPSTCWPLERWALPLARALARTHAAGWVHLDVKPANVLLRAPGAPLLSDFGTARRTGEPSPPGSMGYVSPERMAGEPTDPRDDVYGFGRILEDALESREGRTGGAPVAAWHALAAACVGPYSERPPDGDALASLVARACGG